MTTRLGVVLAPSGPDLVAERLATCLRSQTQPPEEVVLLHPDPGGLARRLRLSKAGLVPVVVARGTPSGAGLQMAMEASTAEYVAVLDGVEVPRPSYLETTVRLLQGGDGVAATSQRSMEDGALDLPVGTSRAEVIASPWAVPGPTLVRREALQAAGGLDPELDGLALWDLWIRITAAGHSIAVAPERLLAGICVGNPAFAATALVGRYLPAVRRIFEKHQALLRANASVVVAAPEPRLRSIWVRERELIDRHEQGLEELGRLDAKLRGLRERLHPAGRDTFEWNDLRAGPVSRNWGSERGTPVDRPYIHRFVESHAEDVHGNVLEILDSGLTERCGARRVDRSDVLDIDPSNPRATVVADLRHAPELPSDFYDCIILTQTLHLIDDMEAVLRTVHRILRPGGVLLVTVPCLSMTATEYGRNGDCWRMTAAGARFLFERVFPPSAVEIEEHGNVVAATAFLHGVTVEEMRPGELDGDDPAYPVIVTVRAVKPFAPAIASRPVPRAAILLYHRVATPVRDVHGLAIDPGLFERQLELLVARFKPTTLLDLVAQIEARDLQDRALVLTFDDGTSDLLDEVVPRLEEHGVPATFFLTTEGLERRMEHWWDCLERLVLGAPHLPAEIRLSDATGFARFDAADRSRLHALLYARVKGLRPAERDHALRELGRQIPDPPPPATMALSAAEIARLPPRIEVGAHTVHHPSLPLLSPAERLHEMLDSRAALERITSRPVVSFAYPYGDLDDESAALARAAGFRCAVTCEPSSVTATCSPWRLPRFELGRTEPREILARLEQGIEGRGSS